MAQIHCRYFSGYKPCGKNSTCDQSCPHLDKPALSILLIHLGALGAVLRATSLLPAIKRKFPSSRITWVTDSPGQNLLLHNPLIDRILTTTESDLLALSALEFDMAMVIDKSLKASGVLKRTQADLIYGFKVEPRTGAILPATAAATELWSLGLDNDKKFFVNRKPETQLMCEALELEYLRDEYLVRLSLPEQESVRQRRSLWSDNDQRFVVGINTGCSGVIPYKKLSVDFQRRMILKIQKEFACRVVLLGGPEDTLRNQQIAEGIDVISSATESGLRDGLVSTAACDIVVTGDSLGMHMAIALKKYVIAWFGPTCAHEIDLYDHGSLVLTQAPCAPCWKRYCSEAVMCYDQVHLDDIIEAVKCGLRKTKVDKIAQPVQAVSSQFRQDISL